MLYSFVEVQKIVLVEEVVEVIQVRESLLPLASLDPNLVIPEFLFSDFVCSFGHLPRQYLPPLRYRHHF